MQINTTSDALDNLNKKLGGADIEIEPSTNKVDALKKIYKTLGGTDDVAGLSTVYQVLEKITEVAEGGGGESGLMIATYVPVDSRINLNKSFNEVAAIMASGAVPYIVIDNSISGYINIPEGTIVPFTIFDNSEGITGAAFYDGGYNAIVFEISCGLDGTLFFYVD